MAHFVCCASLSRQPAKSVHSAKHVAVFTQEAARWEDPNTAVPHIISSLGDRYVVEALAATRRTTHFCEETLHTVQRDHRALYERRWIETEVRGCCGLIWVQNQRGSTDTC